MKRAIFIIFLVFVIAISYILISSKENEKELENNSINSFDDCVLAGNPILESYPRQCVNEDNIFIEEIEDEIINENELDLENNEEIDENIYNEREELLRSYLDENISEISPEKEVLGGIFFVTSLILNGEDEFIVEYEDGHIALEASGKYFIDEENNIYIQEFTLLEDEESEYEESEIE